MLIGKVWKTQYHNNQENLNLRDVDQVLAIIEKETQVVINKIKNTITNMMKSMTKKNQNNLKLMWNQILRQNNKEEFNNIETQKS